MMHQATGGNTEILAQGWVVAQSQLLAKKGRLQLIVELAVQLLAGREELLTAQMAMVVRSWFIEPFNPLFKKKDTAKSTRKYRSPNKRPQKNLRCRTLFPIKTPPKRQAII